MAAKTGEAVQRIEERTRKRVGGYGGEEREMRTSPMEEMEIDAIDGDGDGDVGVVVSRSGQVFIFIFFWGGVK